MSNINVITDHNRVFELFERGTLKGWMFVLHWKEVPQQKLEQLRKALRENGINLPGYNVMPQTFYRRAFMLLFGFPIRQDVEENRNTREAFRKIVTLSAERGWAEYRTAPVFMDNVMDVYSFNDNILRRFNETLKDAVDPNGIISAGRSGIWPKHLRKA